MNKTDLFKTIKAKGIDEKEIKAKYDEFKDWLKEKGIPEKDLENTTLEKLYTYYKKIFFSPAKMFEGVIYGIDRVNDFGAQKLFNQAKAAYEEDRDKAISLGITDEEGNPLYSGNRAPVQGRRLIDLNQDRRKNIYLLVKCIEGEKVDKDYKEAILTLRPNKFDIEIPLFKKVKFKANIGNKTTEDLYVLNQSDLLQFEIIDDKEIDVESFIEKYLKSNYVKDLTKLEEWHEKRKDTYDRRAIIKGTVSAVRFTTTGNNNILNINSGVLAWDAKPITCWVPDYIDMDFDESAMNVIVVGQTNMGLDKFSGEQRVTLSVLGLYCPPMFRIEKKQKEDIEPQQIVEQVSEPTEETFTEDDW